MQNESEIRIDNQALFNKKMVINNKKFKKTLLFS